MNNRNKLIITTSISIALTACGGSASDLPASATLKGTAIDGYLTGATVFLDVNFDGKLNKR
jgi:hypothetical protein